VALEQWKEEGDLFLIGMDANDNVRTGDVNAMLWNLGLVDVHHAKHPHLPTTAICNKNTKGFPSMASGHHPLLNALQQATTDLVSLPWTRRITACFGQTSCLNPFLVSNLQNQRIQLPNDSPSTTPVW
jgi:hypothetical protein